MAARTARLHLRQPRHADHQDVHLPRAPGQVARCAGALAELGVSKGDRVIIYMPWSLGGHRNACRRAAGGNPFSSLRRVRLARTPAVDDAQLRSSSQDRAGSSRGGCCLSRSSMRDRVGEHKPKHCLILSVRWARAGRAACRWHDVVPRGAARLVPWRQPIAHILYTSGTTGQPRSFVTTEATRRAGLVDGSFTGSRPGSVLGYLDIGPLALLHGVGHHPRLHERDVRRQADRHT